MDKPLIRVVAAIISDGHNRTLVTQRPADQHLGGYWEFPGGQIEDGETPQETLVREIREELDVNIIVDDFIWQERFEYDIKIVDIAFYSCTLIDKTQKIVCKEVADFRWISNEQFKELTFPPADQEMIKRLIEDKIYYFNGRGSGD